MSGVLKLLMHFIQDADPEGCGTHALEPVKPHEKVLGTLSDESRQILTTLAFQLEGINAHSREKAMLKSHPHAQTNQELDRWAATSRILQARYELLRALFTASVYSDVEEVAFYTTYFIREGFVVVGTNEVEEEGLQKATNAALKSTLGDPES